MSRGPKAVALDLSQQAQGEIQRLLRRHGTGQALVSRLRIILACAEPGATNLGVATALGVSRQTVALWRSRFAAHRLPGLVDAPRSGAPRSIGDEAVERLVALTLEEAPANATHWSTRAMARRTGMSQTGMSQSAVSRIWRAFGLRPHQADTFKLSADPAFVEKVRDVVGLSLAPPDRALVLCVDEKPQIQAVQGTAAAFPLRPGQAERVTHDYRPHGTLDLFAALDVKAGTVIGSCKPRHRSVEFRAFLEQVESSVARDLEVHLVLDNLKTHKTTLVHDGLVQHPRFHLHFTPTSASWLNLVECWFSVLSRRRLERGAFSSTEGLEAAIRDYIAETNAHPKPFVWTKSADAILASVGRFCTQISNSDQ
ncbi:IS630 family transposase [Methylobacterium currus]|uniref:IS630 family transposase n=1 Tax=Methylobacterium currus TaxID=2051553 RepID=A0A2R4WVR9_9HYPH|nr:IS630 family transposase [Methylobacterium currus]AWB25625.1 IS630 family transposase [Methylobacterium currus]